MLQGSPGNPVPVAIIVLAAAGAAAGLRGAVTDSLYHVNSIPQIVAVDKRGIIRQVVTGWDRGNEDRLTRLIEQLERQPGS